MKVAALLILALTLGISLSRPKIFKLRIDHAHAGVIGAILCIIFGVVPFHQATGALAFIAKPVITILSLMTITIIVEHTGLFELLAERIAIAANGNAKRLFLYIFVTGSLLGTLFTNDAAVLIFTPLVFNLVERIRENSWNLSSCIPYYFAVLYVANVAGAFIISNPINIIASSFFGISFTGYAVWMIIPAIVSIISSYAGIRIIFAKQIPDSYKKLEHTPIDKAKQKSMIICGVILFLTLMAFFTEPLTGIPTWIVAVGSALILLIIHPFINKSSYKAVVKGIGWDVIFFVTGIFIVARGITISGLTDGLSLFLNELYSSGMLIITHCTGLIAAGLSAVMNNHPTADMMAMLISNMNIPEFSSKMLLFSALIGGDLGPKMLPVGSLAALMWFRILRKKGVDIPYGLYIKIGIPVSIAAILLAIMVLNLEIFLYSMF